MKLIRLYDWEDKLKRRAVREVRVLSTQDMTRNGIRRIYAWTDGRDEANLMLYPAQGTAYPEYEERLQKQRTSKVFLYDAEE